MGTKYSSSFLKTGSLTSGCLSSASEWKSNVDQASSPAGGIRDWSQLFHSIRFHSTVLLGNCVRSRAECRRSFKKKRHSSTVHVCRLSLLETSEGLSLPQPLKRNWEVLEMQGGTGFLHSQSERSGIQRQRCLWHWSPNSRPAVSLCLICQVFL